MLEGERLVRSAPFSGIAVRLAGIYGPGRTSLVDRVKRGEARTPRTPLYTNRIHVDDAALVLRHVLDVEAPEPVYIGVDRDPAELGEVQAFLAERLGLPKPPLEDDDARAAEGRRARTNKRCRSLHLGALALRHPTYREGYAAMLR
jgi:nucleoside-diphosphate-sugar epimerase